MKRNIIASIFIVLVAIFILLYLNNYKMHEKIRQDYDYVVMKSDSGEAGSDYYIKQLDDGSFYYVEYKWNTSSWGSSEINERLGKKGRILSKEHAIKLFGENAIYLSPEREDKTEEFYKRIIH